MAYMTDAERNRKIKKALSEVFGRKNVSVRGGTGTAYGWVYITIKEKKKHKKCLEGEIPIMGCPICREEKWKIKDKVVDILRKHKLLGTIGTYYSDTGYPGHTSSKCIIDVELI